MVTLQFIPHSEIEGISSSKRIKKLLDLAKTNKIVLLEGRITKQEEAELIRKTMEEINQRFKGIELSVIYPDQQDAALMRRLRSKFISFLLGDRQGLTIIGPATIVKERSERTLTRSSCSCGGITDATPMRSMQHILF
ncbi:MAG: DUF2073 domain-containing protein [Nanoarchaeota archaeon]